MMKIPSPTTSMVSAMAALSRLHAKDPMIFEKSFQTLTASSLSWIDNGILSELNELSPGSSDGASETTIPSACAIEHETELPSASEELPDKHYYCHRVIAEALIRRKVHTILDKYKDISSPERVEEALKHHILPESLQRELFAKYGGKSPPTTWYGALEQLCDFCSDQTKHGKGNGNSNDNSLGRNEMLWEHILDHPITSYVPVQCQSCGEHIVPDVYDSSHASTSAEEDAKLGLKEKAPTPQEAPLVRTGWFRGPRMTPSVFVLDCPKCGASSRWFRSRDPRIILNPHKWGRLCGEQEDLRLDLANYLGFVSIRTILPLDWDHIWSEFRIVPPEEESNDNDKGNPPCDQDATTTRSSSGDSDTANPWRMKDDDRNFAVRLEEGIGSWTRILAVSPNPDFCSDVTNSFLSCASQGGRAKDEFLPRMEGYRQKITEARREASGASTQAGTVHGYAMERAGLTTSEITVVMKRAAREYGSRTWYQV